MSGQGGMKYDGGKVRYSLLAPGFVRAVVEVLGYGAQKYSDHGWKTVPDAVERYSDAAWRHREAWLDGEDLDLETGISHMAHVACNAMVLFWYERCRPDLVDEFRKRRNGFTIEDEEENR